MARRRRAARPRVALDQGHAPATLAGRPRCRSRQPRYQRLLGCTSAHGGREYERLVAGDRLILQLHAWHVEHDHANLGDPGAKPSGNGVLVWFEVDDFDDAVTRARDLQAEVVLAPHRNPPESEPGGPAHREVWLRDPEGYTVVLASPDGEAA